MSPERLIELEAAAERGDWAAMRELPLELWPEITPAMEATLQGLSVEEKQTFNAMLEAIARE